jgi:hypothetical protein
MTRAAKVLRVFTLAVVAPFLAFAAPAEAGGSIGFTVSPKGRDAEALRTGLALYSAVRGIRTSKKNRAKIEQYGDGNGAVIQRGSGNSGSISQNGIRSRWFSWVSATRRTSARTATATRVSASSSAGMG